MKILILFLFLAGCATAPQTQYVTRCAGCGEQVATTKIVADNFHPVTGGFIEIKTAEFHCVKCGKTFVRPISSEGIHESLAAKPWAK